MGLVIGIMSYIGFRNTGSPTLFRLTIAFSSISLGFFVIWTGYMVEDFVTKTGNVESGGKKNIAMWMLDTDYDNRSLFPSQVFFPIAGAKDGWAKLAKNLKAEIDEEKIEAFKGTISLPFEAGSAVAVKIIDDRGIECLRVVIV